MTTITLLSNNSKAIWEAADTIERVGWDKARTYCYFRQMPDQEPLVIVRIGDGSKLSNEDVIRFRYQREVAVNGPILF